MMAGDTGLEPVDDGVKVRCLTDLANPQRALGAGEGNRTLVTGLGSQGSAIELHPQKGGGGRRIRTFEIADNGFTVRPLWPLGNPSK